MPMKKNTYYWEYSLEHPEPEDLEEEPYIHDKRIVDDFKYLAQVNYLRDLLTTYCTISRLIEREPSFAHEQLGVSSAATDELSENPQGIYQVVLKAIDRLLISVENIQHTEFVAYFKCFGMSHSDYRRKAEMQRLTILEKILQRYCKRRKERYDQLGYTHVIQQSLYDSAVSRTQGVSGTQKLCQIIEQVAQESKVTIQEAKTSLEFIRSEYSFYTIISKKAFNELKRDINFIYKYGQETQEKVPDLVIKIRDKLFILEAKHIRESGGAQDKQIAELIKFIRQRESKPISYVAFLDGRYFNKFRDTSPADKVCKQRDEIERALEDYPSNYFVNTAGLRKLLADLLSETAGNSDSQTIIPYAQ